MEKWFPHLAQSGKTLMAVDDDKSHIYVMICRATTKETIQGEAFKNTTTRSRQNPKKCLSNPQEGKRREAEKTNRKEIIK